MYVLECLIVLKRKVFASGGTRRYAVLPPAKLGSTASFSRPSPSMARDEFATLPMGRCKLFCSKASSPSDLF
ncbi:hypothetical protein EHR05_10415 [Leptospira licerasiae]|nr:hypothetical protein EHR05_10415 [Leptospira licerasiae]